MTTTKPSTPTTPTGTPLHSSHAEFPPSALRSWERCPAFDNDPGDGVAGAEGTLLHKACQTGELEGLTDEQKKQVVYVLDYVGKQLSQRGEAVRKAKLATPSLAETPEPKQDLKEIKVNVAGMTWGTADRLLMWEHLADLIDYKFGFNAVDAAEHNLQGQAYAVGVFNDFPEIVRVKVHFVSPRRDEVTTHIFDRVDLNLLKLRIASVIARRQEWLANRRPEYATPDEDLCLYCANKASCHQMHRLALRIAPNYDDQFELPSEYHPSMITSGEQMAKALTVARVLERWCQSVKEHSLELALNGEDLPGFELTERAGSRKITDAQACYLAVKDLLTMEEYLPACSVSASSLESAIGAKASRGQKGKLVSEFKERLADLGLTIQGEKVRFLQKIKSK